MIRRSIAFSVADKYAGIVLGLGTMAIVSRILTPEEVGLFMVASAAVILIETFRDFGVGACIIQVEELTPALVRTAFTVMAILSLVLAGVLWIAAQPMAEFFGDDRLAGMIRIATLAFITAPISNPLLSLLRRDLAFDKVAAISIIASATNAVVTVGLAALGFGPASFVWAWVTAASVMAAGALMVRPDFWVFRPSLRDWRHVVPFGAWSSIVTLLQLIFDYMPRFILGRVISIEAVGLYSRSLSLCQMPDRALLSAVQPVVLPALSARARGGGDMKEPYFLGLACITALQWPALLCLALLAEPIVRLLLGSQWTETVPLIRILALASLCLFPTYLAYPVLVAVGRVKDLAIASLISLPLCMVIMFLAAQISLTAVAFSLFLTAPLHVGVGLHFVRRHVGFGWGEFLHATAPSVLVALGATAVPAALLAMSGGTLGIGGMGLAIVGSALGWIAGLRFARHPLDPEVRIFVGKIAALVFRQTRLGTF